MSGEKREASGETSFQLLRSSLFTLSTFVATNKSQTARRVRSMSRLSSLVSRLSSLVSRLSLLASRFSLLAARRSFRFSPLHVDIRFLTIMIDFVPGAVPPLATV